MTPKKLKVHDTFQVMESFSNAWQQYPVLFDEKVRNAKFSEDFKGAGAHMRDCYAELVRELGMTVDEVRKQRTKYVDGVTKALGQLKTDIQEGTTACPVPAMYKLIAFRWLWKYSRNYDDELMSDFVFDEYMECAMTVDLRRLTRLKQPTDTVEKALDIVRKFNARKKLEGLECGLECELDDVTLDDDSSCCTVQEYEVCNAMSSICSYLPPSKDPTFRYAEAGYIVFNDGVSVSLTESVPKGVRKRSDAILSALKASGYASFKATQALQAAQTAEDMYVNAHAALFAYDAIADGETTNEHALVKLQANVLHSLCQFQNRVSEAVCSAEGYVQHYYSLRDTAQMMVTAVSVLKKKCARDNIAHLRALRDKSKLYSSDKWICVLLQQL